MGIVSYISISQQNSLYQFKACEFNSHKAIELSPSLYVSRTHKANIILIKFRPNSNEIRIICIFIFDYCSIVGVIYAYGKQIAACCVQFHSVSEETIRTRNADELQTTYRI